MERRLGLQGHIPVASRTQAAARFEVFMTLESWAGGRLMIYQVERWAVTTVGSASVNGEDCNHTLVSQCWRVFVMYK